MNRFFLFIKWSIFLSELVERCLKDVSIEAVGNKSFMLSYAIEVRFFNFTVDYVGVFAALVFPLCRHCNAVVTGTPVYKNEFTENFILRRCTILVAFI